MATITEADVIEALRPVEDPELHRSIVDLEMVRAVAIDGPVVAVQIALTVAGCPLRNEIQRRVNDAVVAALEFGRQVRARGAEIFVLGRRDIARARRVGVDLSDLEGVQVICAPNGGPVLTCYRNRNVSGIRDRGWLGTRRYV